jgi:hypothetical protein
MLKTVPTTIRYSILLCLVFSSVCLNAAENGDPQNSTSPAWNRFRGPNGQGVVESSTIPVKWDVNSIAWQTTFPGKGYSSPILWQNQIYVTYSTSHPLQGVVVALDVVTGQIRWQTSYPLERSRISGMNSYASSTPTANRDGRAFSTRNPGPVGSYTPYT